MNARLRDEVEKLCRSEGDPEVLAQALNDFWWFHKGQPEELTEILSTVIRFHTMKGIEHALDTYSRSARPDRQGHEDWLPFTGDRDRDEWASETVRP